MKTRRLTTVPTSACLLVMLALSVMPIRSNAADTNNAPTKAEPVMTEELMNRLIKRAKASKRDYSITAETCGIFNLCTPIKELPARQILYKIPEGNHMFMVPLKEGSTDIVIGFRTETTSELYLTNKAGTLRAAALGDTNGLKLITNEAATEKFKSEMQLLANLATKLPPSTEDNPPVKK